MTIKKHRIADDVAPDSEIPPQRMSGLRGIVSNRNVLKPVPPSSWTPRLHGVPKPREDKLPFKSVTDDETNRIGLGQQGILFQVLEQIIT